MVIIESSANIRPDSGTDYDVVSTENKGDVFTATGNQETASDGKAIYQTHNYVQ